VSIPPVGATCSQAVQEPSFELFPAATPSALSPWEFVGSRFTFPYSYNLAPETKRSGTKSLRVSIGVFSSGYTASTEFQQQNVVVCPNTLYEFKSWNVIYTANTQMTCQVALKVNNRVVTMGDPFTYTASRQFTSTSGYYLTGESDTNVRLKLKLYCVGPVGQGTAQTAVYFDDVTFTPVVSL
jgi:hypothetical protein